MKRTALVIGLTCIFGSMYSLEVNAQEDNFEITLDAVLDNADEVDGLIMTVIDDEHDRDVNESAELHENDGEVDDEAEHDELFGRDDGAADDFDDGHFDDYDDGEVVGTPEEERHDEPGMDELELDGDVVDEPAIDEPEMDEPVVDELGIDEPGLDEPGVDEPDVV